MKIYSMPEAVKELGVAYHRIYYAILTRHIEPMQAGRSRVLTQTDINKLRQHFSNKEEE